VDGHSGCRFGLGLSEGQGFLAGVIGKIGWKTGVAGGIGQRLRPKLEAAEG